MRQGRALERIVNSASLEGPEPLRQHEDQKVTEDHCMQNWNLQHDHESLARTTESDSIESDRDADT